MEELVVSLEIAKRLREVGWPQKKDYFAWYIYPDVPFGQREPGIEQPHDAVERFHEKGWKVKLEQYSAPTAEEILRRLPRFVSVHVLQDPTAYCIDIPDPRSQTEYLYKSNSGNSLANVAAHCWLYLVENKLIDPSK